MNPLNFEANKAIPFAIQLCKTGFLNSLRSDPSLIFKNHVIHFRRRNAPGFPLSGDGFPTSSGSETSEREVVEGNLQKEATPMGRELLQESDQKRNQGFFGRVGRPWRRRSIRGRLGVGSVFAGNSHHKSVREGTSFLRSPSTRIRLPPPIGVAGMKRGSRIYERRPPAKTSSNPIPSREHDPRRIACT